MKTEEQKAKARARNAAYYQRNIDRIRVKKKAEYLSKIDFYKEYERNRQYQKMYGISIPEYEAMLDKQGGKCKMCGTEEPKTRGGKHFAVDHCHETGVVRGLLCNHCNIALGFYEVRSEKIHTYLQEHSKKEVN